ncbi:MAG TPA: threonine synthase [Polyangiaceae bacterium]|nr:threonine synthase [Polyangiaceae bacterium]
MHRPSRPNPLLRGLSCFACETPHDPLRAQGVCTRCGMPLRVDYAFTPGCVEVASLRGSSLWRYRDVLPVVAGEVTLSEGFTPLLPVGERVWVKDEARNPTGSFKARGMTAAVTMAKHFGARALSAPSAGNAAGALAAYGAAAGLPVTVAMPEDTPHSFVEECRLYGADVHLVAGTIADAGAYLRSHGPKDAFDVSTLREPYRVEGKKTMAYELFEQFDGELPDVIIYPTGGGTGLVGMWKAFHEMEALGWIRPGAAKPKLVSVQAEGCAPVVKGFREGAEKTVPWPSPHTTAYGLRVPSPIAGFVCLRALRETRGTGVTVSEETIGTATRALARISGIDVCPEGGAAWAALDQLRQNRFIGERDRVVVFNTGTGLKYR